MGHAADTGRCIGKAGSFSQKNALPMHRLVLSGPLCVWAILEMLEAQAQQQASTCRCFSPLYWIDVSCRIVQGCFPPGAC